MMNINKHGIALIKEKEACVLYSYDDKDGSWPRKAVKPGQKVRGVLTIGYGHTGPDVTPGQTCTEAQAEEWLEQDLAGFVKELNEDLKGVKLTSNQFSALASLVFNIGDPAFDRSTMLRFLRAGDFASASNQFPRWHYDDGVKSEGLLKRRLAEQKLFNTPDDAGPGK